MRTYPPGQTDGLHWKTRAESGLAYEQDRAVDWACRMDLGRSEFGGLHHVHASDDVLAALRDSVAYLTPSTRYRRAINGSLGRRSARGGACKPVVNVAGAVEWVAASHDGGCEAMSGIADRVYSQTLAALFSLSQKTGLDDLEQAIGKRAGRFPPALGDEDDRLDDAEVFDTRRTPRTA